MMTNHIVEHLYLYFDVIFLYVGNTFILLIMIVFELHYTPLNRATGKSGIEG